MVGFAERMGHRTARSVVQSDSLDEETRTEFWNLLVLVRSTFHEAYSRGSTDTIEDDMLGAVWAWEFKLPRDEMPSAQGVWDLIKRQILTAEWVTVLDLIEALVKYMHRYSSDGSATIWSTVADAYNDKFEHYLVGYRFIGREITPVDSNAEADAVVGAQEAADTIAGARHALAQAIERLADRQNPDYPNSIKESISAVEAVVRKITGETTLGDGLRRLERAGLTIHPALKSAWSKMYGYTSDDDGIRHGGIEAANADQALAKYMLVTCSAFVSYLIEEARKTGLL